MIGHTISKNSSKVRRLKKLSKNADIQLRIKQLDTASGELLMIETGVKPVSEV